MCIITKSQIETYYEWYKNQADEDDTVMFAHHMSVREGKGLSAMNNEDMKVQAKMWRKMVKSGDLTIRFVNSKQRTIKDGTTWYWFVVQSLNEDIDCDPMGLMLLGEMVNGMVYAFKHEANRDRIQNYIMKGVEQVPCVGD